MTLLDTHAWVWWISNPERLSTTAQAAIQRALQAGGAAVSSISAWEVAMLWRRGRLELTMDVHDWMARAEALPFFRFVPIDNAIAVRSVTLPAPLHADPADRIIVATALILGATLVTKDRRLRDISTIKTIW